MGFIYLLYLLFTSKFEILCSTFIIQKKTRTCPGNTTLKNSPEKLVIHPALHLEIKPGFALRAMPWQSSFAVFTANEDWLAKAKFAALPYGWSKPGFALRAMPWQSSFAVFTASEDWGTRIRTLTN